MEFIVKTDKEFREEYYVNTVRRDVTTHKIPWEKIYKEMAWDSNWVLVAEDTQGTCRITHDPWDSLRDCFRWK